MSRLLNKTALITGGTTGIGLATAKLFVAEGARVAITGSDPRRLAEAGTILGPDILTIQADAGDVADQKRIATTLATAFGKNWTQCF
jgi:NAD(P)-dependent dehydrogenase (short-subunit alcohol dehydrogenase family)